MKKTNRYFNALKTQIAAIYSNIELHIWNANMCFKLFRIQCYRGRNIVYNFIRKFYFLKCQIVDNLKKIFPTVIECLCWYVGCVYALWSDIVAVECC